jgi:Spy/CpxP family protein refolding chaperone
MTGKMTVMGATLLVATAMAAGPLDAQRGPGIRGGGGPNMGRSLELVLERQEELALSQDQVTQLQELKASVDGDVAPVMEEMAALRARIRGGEMDRDDGLRQMEALRGELITNSAPMQGRVQQILTVEQHQKLQPLVRQSQRPGVGRAGAVRGQGPRLGARGRAAGRGSGGGVGLGRGRRGGQAGAPGIRGVRAGRSFSGRLGPGRINRRGLGAQPPMGNGRIGGLPPRGF